MTEIPTTLTTDQRRAACQALGLAPSLVHELTLGPDGLRALLNVRDREGRIIKHGPDPLTTTVHIPYEQEVTRAPA
ncbi:hypothetical protein AB0I84_31570 [Streptomyces spectabilis]|uniref:hypothetical protein n=1 Tax=Streptomyces spectabilis TaxID=68270 RepID=UPI0033CACE80